MTDIPTPEFIKRTRVYRRSSWYALYRCSCGTEFEALQNNVNKGNTNSCGCYGRVRRREAVTKHGDTDSKTYYIWHSMRARCRYPSAISYKNYGGRGIDVCERWQRYENFLADMGPCPPNYSIERIDPNGNYEPGNCCWIPKSEQGLNTRRTVYLEFRGERHTLQEWSKRTGISPTALYHRIARGWSVERMLTIPMRRQRGQQ